MPTLRQSFKQKATTGIIVASAAMLASCAQDAKAPADAAAQAAVINELRAEVAYLKDRQNIHDVYLRYMRGFDRNDVELMRSAFWPDVQINYGTQSNTFDEFAVGHLPRHMAGLMSWGHLITNETVDIDGDAAHVESYVTGLFQGKNKKARQEGALIISGRYIDRVDRRNGEWRIAVREFIPHFATRDYEAVQKLYEKAGKLVTDCALGTWDRRDPSYRRPLNARMDKEVGPVCAE